MSFEPNPYAPPSLAETASFGQKGGTHQWEDELKKSTGKNGRSRIANAGKSRRNVRQQMQRDIKHKIAL